MKIADAAPERIRFWKHCFLGADAKREYMAQIEATLGNAGAAVPLLSRLLDTPYYFPVTIANLRLDPVWDSIRRDPRFQALLKPDDDASNVAKSGSG